jgi:hypothetical protein
MPLFRVSSPDAQPASAAWTAVFHEELLPLFRVYGMTGVDNRSNSETWSIHIPIEVARNENCHDR